MHIEERKLKNKVKYYLAQSIRSRNKVRKIRVYLGANKKEAEENKARGELIIKEKVKSYKSINDPFQSAINSEELGEIKSLEARENIHITHLSEDEWTQFIEAFTYDTNAIEGSTVTFDEVKDILKENKWPKQRKKWEISETYGVADAIEYIKKTKEHISFSLIKELHIIVFRNSKDFAGQFRKKGEEVVVVDSFGNIIHRGAPSELVAQLLKDVIKWYNKNKKKYPVILLAGVVHNQFEMIHPFADGNGRVGRLLLNNILLKHNKPPINIELRNRGEYYSSLREYENNKNIRPIIELILKEYRNIKKKIKR